MITKKTLKTPTNFYCEKCSFSCYKQSDFNRHLSTQKHIRMTQNDKKNAYFDCECGKSFKYRQGLHKHKKLCATEVPAGQSPIVDSSIVLELLKQNNEFKQLISEQSKQILELSNKVGNTTTNNTITNNNQSFNLNFFLNEQCKNAMNIEDFIASLQLELEDLTETKRLGFVQGISRIFTNKLQELDIYSRPLHCTDIKRETVYIKDDNQWEKDNHSKDKLKSIVNRVANKNYQQLPKWQEEHPNYMTMDSEECNEFIELTCKALGGKNNNEDDKFKQRIVKNVLKEVTLEKLN
jgi:hypothetical protein